MTETFEPDGRAIPYLDEGTGPALVLVPGRGLNVTVFGALASALVEEDFRIVRIGTRRPQADAAVTVADLARDVVDVMDHLGVEDAWVGGHAFGGTVARAVSLAHTDRVNGVLLLAVEGHDDLDEDALAVLHAQIADSARDADAEPVQRAARAAMTAAERSALAPGIPVLAIQGGADALTPPANGEALQAGAPDRVSVVTIEGGGHLFLATRAGETSWAIEDYLDWD